jgi:hypothetical protein
MSLFFANSSCCPTRFANLSVASKYSFVALTRFSKGFIAIEQSTRDKLLCDCRSNFAGLADDYPSAQMNILFSVVWLKLKYSPGRATDNSTTHAFGASRSGDTPSHWNLGSEKVEAGYHPGDT